MWVQSPDIEYMSTSDDVERLLRGQYINVSLSPTARLLAKRIHHPQHPPICARARGRASNSYIRYAITDNLMALPPGPSNACANAWSAIFAAHSELAREMTEENGPCLRGEYHYKISQAAWLECARAGCVWCNFLAKHFEFPARCQCWWRRCAPKVRLRVEHFAAHGVLGWMKISWKPCCKPSLARWKCFDLYTTAGALGMLHRYLALIMLKRARTTR